jgi:hypothetical protein
MVNEYGSVFSIYEKLMKIFLPTIFVTQNANKKGFDFDAFIKKRWLIKRQNPSSSLLLIVMADQPTPLKISRTLFFFRT